MMTWKNAVRRLQPSTSAEFSMSLGISLKKLRMMKVEPGSRSAMATSTTPSSVLSSLVYINTYKILMSSSTPGNRRRIRSSFCKKFLPVKRMRESA